MCLTHTAGLGFATFTTVHSDPQGSVIALTESGPPSARALTAKLQGLNDRFSDLFTARILEHDPRTKGIVRLPRKELETALRALIEKVNAYILIFGDAGLAAAVASANSILSDARHLLTVAPTSAAPPPEKAPARQRSRRNGEAFPGLRWHRTGTSVLTSPSLRRFRGNRPITNHCPRATPARGWFSVSGRRR